MLDRVASALKTIFAYPQKPVTRRKMLAFAGRSILLGLGAGALVWDQATRPPAMRSSLAISQLANQVRKVIKKTQMSPRYADFKNTVVSLLSQGKIKVIESNTMAKHESFAVYNSKTNTIEIDAGAERSAPGQFRATLMHELFHAYQDYQQRKLKDSVREAEALLAEYDFLFHQGVKIDDSWFIITNLPRESGSSLTYFGFRFNVPLSIIKSCAGKDALDPAYQQALKIISQTRLLANYFKFQGILSEDYYKAFNKEINSIDKVLAARKKIRTSLKQLWHDPKTIEQSVKSQGATMLPHQEIISAYLALGQVIIKKYLSRRQIVEAQSTHNQTFEAFKQIIGPVDLSAFDVSYQFDGID